MAKGSFGEELSRIDATIAAAKQADIEPLKAAIEAASQQSIIAIGSGGSFTAATLFSSLHESFTGRVSRAATPLELIVSPTIASNSPIFIVSAEGKNPDVLEALSRARRSSSRTIHVLTNRGESPLIDLVNRLADVNAHVFKLDKKDGYLATNSLVLDSSIIARAYGEMDGQADVLPRDLASQRIGDVSFYTWVETVREFAAHSAGKRGTIVLFSPRLRHLAIDIESKLSESALRYCQLADFRSFAHGRHLWLTNRADDCSLVILTEPAVYGLWLDMKSSIPPELPTLHMSLPDASPRSLIGGLAGVMHLVDALSQTSGVDVARPEVSDFGRSLYYADLPRLIQPQSQDESRRGEVSKYEAYGSFWPSRKKGGRLTRPLRAFEAEWIGREFRGIVFDYDGTLSSSSRRNMEPSVKVMEKIISLLSSGVLIGVASGRGGSVRDIFQEAIPDQLKQGFYLGLYNGGWTGGLDHDVGKTAGPSPEILLHCKRLMEGLREIGAPIEDVRLTPPYQVSIRFVGGVSTESMWFVVADALRQAGISSVSVVRSKHSIDILAKETGKSNLISELIASAGLDPYEIVTMGDVGAWPGNDYSLLEHRFSLSVDLPSRRLDRGWKLAPNHVRDVDATLWYLDRAVTSGNGTFYFNFDGAAGAINEGRKRG